MPVIGLPLSVELGGFPIVPKLSTRVVRLDAAIAAHLEWTTTLLAMLQFVRTGIDFASRFPLSDSPSDLLDKCVEFVERGRTTFDFLPLGRLTTVPYTYNDAIEARLRARLLSDQKKRQSGIFIRASRTRSNPKVRLRQRIPHR